MKRFLLALALVAVGAPVTLMAQEDADTGMSGDEESASEEPME